MKTVNIFGKSTLTILLAGGLLFTACKKDSQESPLVQEEATIQSTQNDEEADAAYDEVFNTTMGVGQESGEDIGLTAGVGVFGRMEGGSYTGRVDSAGQRCFTMTVLPKDKGVFPKTITLDFGAGCLGKDGRLRKGKIITVFTGPMRVPGSKATTTFEGYKVDSVSVAGTHEVVNNSTSNNASLTVRVIAGKLTWDSGRWVKWSTTRTTTQIEGNGTVFFPLDDIFQITGAGAGENSFGRTWSHEIIEPLIKKFTCRWISKGVIRVTHNAKSALLNFGTGDCDNKATLTINGVDKEITLR